jgi:hypothetical protein
VQKRVKKATVVVVIQLIIAFFFVVGVSERYPTLKTLFHSYFADIFLPFGFYFLLALNADTFPPLKSARTKAILVFSLGATSEALQYFGIYALAITFDPLDFVAYGVGAALAVLVDRQILSRLLSYWD